MSPKSLRSLLIQGLVVVVVLCCAITSAVADPCPLITVNEFGNGTLDFSRCGGGLFPMPGVLAPDPGPGGLASVLTYNLLGPPSLVAGDVLMLDPNGLVLDVVRFNPAGTGGNPAYPASLLFYSDNIDGFDSLGDTPSPPGAFYANRLTIAELGDEINNGAIYTPLAGQPGFVAGFSVTYNLISDGTGAPVPEPGTIVLLGSGLLMIPAAIRRKRQADCGDTAKK